jgi:hypothetical protein
MWILKIILKHGKQDKRKPNGIYVNMFFIGQARLMIEVYLKYGRPAEKTIEIFEKQQEEIKNSVLDQRPDPTK